MLKAFKVSGPSMAPTLRDGDIVITIKAKPRSLRPGLIYVVNHSDLGLVIKRLGDPIGERYRLVGDNPTSTPASVMGTVEAERVTRRAVFLISSKGFKKL